MEKTHADTENVEIPHRQWPWPGIDFFFFIINVTMKQHYLRTCCLRCHLKTEIVSYLPCQFGYFLLVFLAYLPVEILLQQW